MTAQSAQRVAEEFMPAKCREVFHRVRAIRARSMALASRLSSEDQTPQSMPDASPTKWHLAHTTWFFETFVLARSPAYEIFDPDYQFLFNSYYEALGPRQPRPSRGLITRPSADEIVAYRRHVDAGLEDLLSTGQPDGETMAALVLGIAHEEQHQELILTDALHLLAQNPLKPAYDAGQEPGLTSSGPAEARWLEFEGGLVEIGRDVAPAQDSEAFAFDNEGPRHKVYLAPYRLFDRLVTNGDWMQFIEDGGYTRPELWLSDGWATVQAQTWTGPLYWECKGGVWFGFTLSGFEKVDERAPVRHVSFYEADAYARWAGRRLPTEAEWEHAAMTLTDVGRSALGEAYHTVWEWTASPYTPYPGFRPLEGAAAEYNGKFMINQMILRGASLATPPSHSRPTYRNFFQPHHRWQFTGVRLAADNRPAADTRPGDSPSLDDDGARIFLADVLAGLSASPKTLPSKYLYDEAGSRLFEAICDLPEYYPTRAETSLLSTMAPALSAQIQPGSALIEFGSGASTKTRLLLDATPQLAAYAPVDISRKALEYAAAQISEEYPNLEVVPILGDFTQPISPPRKIQGRTLVGFFPGSTIGNFDENEARRFLTSAWQLLGPSALFIVGFDLTKKQNVMVAAYDDQAGVTAQFNKNILLHINRALGADFSPRNFEHRAVWNAERSRMEMHLVSTALQSVTISDHVFRFAIGEIIHTESSHKYTVDQFETLAKDSGWRINRTEVSLAHQFAVSVLARL